MIDLNDIDFEVIAERVLQRAGDYPSLAYAWQAVVLTEEAGEFAKELRTWCGQSRHPASNRDKMIEELADVVITAAVMAALLAIDLDEAVNQKLVKIQNRGGL